MAQVATAPAQNETRWRVVQLDEVAPVLCLCGQSRRAFGRPEHEVSSIHRVEVEGAAERHYHRRMTETYFILSGEGHVELDGVEVPVRPGTAILIPPLTRHRAIGKLSLLVFPVPAYDPADEFFD